MMKRLALNKDLILLHWDHTMDKVMEELIIIRKQLLAEGKHSPAGDEMLSQILLIMKKLDAKWLQ